MLVEACSEFKKICIKIVEKKDSATECLPKPRESEEPRTQLKPVQRGQRSYKSRSGPGDPARVLSS